MRTYRVIPIGGAIASGWNVEGFEGCDFDFAALDFVREHMPPMGAIGRKGVEMIPGKIPILHAARKTETDEGCCSGQLAAALHCFL